MLNGNCLSLVSPHLQVECNHYDAGPKHPPNFWSINKCDKCGIAWWCLWAIWRLETQNAPVLGTMLNLKITSTVPIWGKFHRCLLVNFADVELPKMQEKCIFPLWRFASGSLLVKRNPEGRTNNYWWFRIPFHHWKGIINPHKYWDLYCFTGVTKRRSSLQRSAICNGRPNGIFQGYWVLMGLVV